MRLPFGPGGTTDIRARLLAEEFARDLGGSIRLAGTGFDNFRKRVADNGLQENQPGTAHTPRRP